MEIPPNADESKQMEIFKGLEDMEAVRGKWKLSPPSLGPPLTACRNHTECAGGWRDQLVEGCPVQSSRLPVPFLVQAQTWVVGLIPLQDTSSLSLSLSSSL